MNSLIMLTTALMTAHTPSTSVYQVETYDSITPQRFYGQMISRDDYGFETYEFGLEACSMREMYPGAIKSETLSTQGRMWSWPRSQFTMESSYPMNACVVTLNKRNMHHHDDHDYHNHHTSRFDMNWPVVVPRNHRHRRVIVRHNDRHRRVIIRHNDRRRRVIVRHNDNRGGVVVRIGNKNNWKHHHGKRHHHKKYKKHHHKKHWH